MGRREGRRITDLACYGYTASDGKDHGLPLAFTTQTSFTHTLSLQPGGAAPGFRDNDNFAVDQLSIYYAGTIAPNLGGFIELNYDGVAQKASLNNLDIRYVREGQLFGQDVVGHHGQQQPDRAGPLEFDARLGISL